MQNINIFDELAKKYPFDDVEKEQTIRKAMSILYANEVKKTNNPTLIALGGQPGSGKTGLVSYSKHKFLLNNEDAYIVKADFCTECFKYSIELQEKYPYYYMEYTKNITEIIMRELLNRIYIDKINVILETSLTRRYFK